MAKIEKQLSKVSTTKELPTKTTTPAVASITQTQTGSSFSNIVGKISSFFGSIFKSAIKPLQQLLIAPPPSSLQATISSAFPKEIPPQVIKAISSQLEPTPPVTTHYAASTPPYVIPKIEYKAASRGEVRPIVPPTPLVQSKLSKEVPSKAEVFSKAASSIVESAGSIQPPSVVTLTPTGQQLAVELLSTYTQPSIKTNVPSDSQVYVFKDPLGGSTQVFEHVIKHGENLSKIARDYGVTIEEILRLNRDRKNAIKSPDLIIAGESIRIPVKTKEITPEQQIRQQILSRQKAPITELNQLISQALESLRTPQVTIPEKAFQDAFAKIFQEQIDYLKETFNKLENLQPANYLERYQKFLSDLGVPQDYQRIFDLQKIIKQTREDVEREAIAAGGIVTQSQIEEIVNFRIRMLKDELSALSDLVEAKERIVEKMMKYVEMDRKEISDRLDSILDLKTKIFNFSFQALKWKYDYFEDLIKRNRSKLMEYVKSGILEEFSSDFLANFADPNSMLYAGVTPEEITTLIRLSRLNREKAELERQKIIQQIEKSRAAERRAEEREKRIKEKEARKEAREERRLKIQEERWQLQKQKEAQKTIKLEDLLPD
ncbi:MAG: LysM peptidoglycan-binding domain-containing protein [Candidatus Aenigmatarchaeota archaeon]